MSGWHPQPQDGGIPPNPATPTSPAQAYAPSVLPIDTDALYYSNGCDVRLRPAVLNTLISEGLALIDRVGLAYRPARLTNLRMGVEYINQKGMPKWLVLTPQASPVHMYFGTLDPPLLNGPNNGMVLTTLPTSANEGAVQINVGDGNWVPVRRNDSEQLEKGDWPANVPQTVNYYNGTWYMTGLVLSQGRGLADTYSLLGVKIFATPGSGTHTLTVGTTAVFVICTGAGGGGGCSAIVNNASGGDAGGTAFAFQGIAAGVTSVPYIVGQGGPDQPNTGLNGYPGSASNFGTYAAASGGSGGAGLWENFLGHNPGIGTTGFLLLRGNPAQDATGGNQPGMGGGSFWGGGGSAESNYQGSAPANARPGSTGGGGGANFAPGGVGRPGRAGGHGVILLFELG